MMNDALPVVASPRRREILRLIWDRELGAGEIHRELEAIDGVTFGAVSQHLRRLEQAGLVVCRRAGRCRRYRACPERLGPLAAALEAMWSDALARLVLRAELEASRRGPRRGGGPVAADESSE